jgi:transposase
MNPTTSSCGLPPHPTTPALPLPHADDNAPHDTRPLPCQPCPLLTALFDARQQAGYWKAMHQRATQREAQLQDEVARLQALLRLREQQLFGRKSEAHPKHPETPPVAADAAAPAGTPADAPPVPRRRRGQQPGHPGHGRRAYTHLPAREEVLDLSPEQRHCQRCGQPFASFPGTDDTTLLEIEVKAYRRVLRRPRYRPTCSCGAHPGIVTAPPPPRLIPHSPFGISLWVTVLLDKYWSYRPTYRLLADLRSHGLDLSQGALTGGLQRLLPLFQPLYDALIEHSRQQALWHGDETRWLVFATVEGKVGYRWYLWAIQSAEEVVFILAAGRAHDVPEEHFGPVEGGILVVDRFKAYPAMDQVKAGLIVLAFCWAHQRRDFLELARSWPTQQDWALGWVARIGELYHRNARRLELREDSEGFEQRDRDLRAAVDAMATQAEAELAAADLHPARRKVLESLGNHWTGLTVFVEHPEVPMDNNAVERTQRGPVVGRKNYYGSGAVWSGELAAMVFSLLATLKLWALNPRLWLTAYLEACAAAGGRAPADVSPYLPWNLSAEQRAAWSLLGQPAARPECSAGVVSNTS